jgi:uncharacterized membrane protein YhaH (DUF805 family)
MEELFTPQARLDRVGYFVGTIWLGFLVGCLAVIGTLGITQGGTGFVGALLWVVPASVVLLWGGTVLTMKRLHDLGLSGVHVIWIWLINIAAGELITLSPVLSILLGLVALGISLSLLFAPGQPYPNQYGSNYRPLDEMGIKAPSE